MLKRRVIDDVVRKIAPPNVLYANPKFKESKISETARVSDKREVIKLNSRKIPNKIELTSNVVTTFNSIARNDSDGIIDVAGKSTIVVPVANIRILKALAYCNMNPNEEYSSALSEMFMYILKQTLNRKIASDDGVITENGTQLQIIVKRQIMSFYIEQCS